MSLEFRAVVERRGFDVEIEVADGEHVAILGHNGSGKSTLLNVLAGTLRPDSGYAAYDGSVLFDIGPGTRFWTQPHTRGISLLAQEALLFPHMTVAQNAAFGPRVKGASRDRATEVARHWLEEVGVSDLSSRKPAQLSGGQAQRVAIARALASDPALLLLDEPMAALDVGVAPALRRVLRRVLTDRSTIMVTHDVLDALLLCERIVVLDHGRVAESGTTDGVLRHPRTEFTAGLAGLNLVRGSYRDNGIDTDRGLRIEGLAVNDDESAMEVGSPAAAVFAPGAVSVFESAPHGSPRNNLVVTIVEVAPTRDLVVVSGHTPQGQVVAADVTVRAVADMDLYPGKQVVFSVKAASVTIYPA